MPALYPYRAGVPYRTFYQEVDQPEKGGRLVAKSIVAVKRPEGTRYYGAAGSGEPDERGESESLLSSEIGAILKSRTAPADSIDTRILKKKYPALFKKTNRDLNKNPYYYNPGKS